MRQPKPFFRNQTQSWYVELDKQQINLGKDEEVAHEKYHELMVKRRRGEVAADGTVVSVLRAYWQWLKQNRAASTSSTRKPILESFAEWIGTKKRVWQLKPHDVQRWCQEAYGSQSSTYQNIVTNAICRALSWGLKAGLIDKNP